MSKTFSKHLHTRRATSRATTNNKNKYKIIKKENMGEKSHEEAIAASSSNSGRCDKNIPNCNIQHLKYTGHAVFKRLKKLLYTFFVCLFSLKQT